MDIPGISPLSGQPTLTNPLTREQLLEGRVTASQGVDTKNTVTVREQRSTTIKNADIVTQNEKPSATALKTTHFGSIIDITV